jgi:hypothetical protein
VSREVIGSKGARTGISKRRERCVEWREVEMSLVKFVECDAVTLDPGMSFQAAVNLASANSNGGRYALTVQQMAKYERDFQAVGRTKAVAIRSLHHSNDARYIVAGGQRSGLR